MKQQLKETVIYQPTPEVKVTVNNTPTVNEKNGLILYKQVVTIRIENGWGEDKLAFHGEEDLRAFLDNVVLEDPQQELAL